MKLSDEMKANLDQRFTALIDCLNSTKDIRKCMSLLPSIAYPIRALLDISQDPSDMFVALLITQQLSFVQSTYDGNSNTWYEVNEENVQKLRKCLATFAEDLKNSIKNDDEEGVINATKAFFSKFHQLARTTSSDVKSSA